MSIILDALKKSETERQRQGQNEFSQVPLRAVQRKTPIWVWAVVGLLAINLLVLLGMLSRSTTSTDSVASAPITSAPINTTTTQQPTRSFASQLEQVRPAPVIEPVATPEPQPSRETPASNVVQKTGVSEQFSNASNSDAPDIDQLRASGELNIGEQRLDIHVFSETPSSRFVFINMTKLREGATTDDGVTVEEITEGGVILSYQGRRFYQGRQ